MVYKAYSDMLKEKYGVKVYKLPVSIPATCPNRDGVLSASGCTFCGAAGAGFENLSPRLSVAEQLKINSEYIRRRYGAKKFIAYFQNFTNTYVPLEKLSEYLKQAAGFENVVEICISTRPDCISDAYLRLISERARSQGRDVTIELGLQSSNYHTLMRINRGHTLAEFIDAAIRIHRFGFSICAHVILNLPWDDDTDTIETAKILTALGVEQVKIHSLYIEKNTELARQYEAGEFVITTMQQYVERAVLFLEHLSPDTAVQRLVSRAPEPETEFCNWDTSWWKIKDMIIKKMEEENTFQGIKCDYLNNDFYTLGRGG